MTAGTPGRLTLFPGGLEEAVIGEPGEHRVERPGFEPGGLGQVISVLPRGHVARELPENGAGLR